MLGGAPSARQLIMVARPEAVLQVRRGSISSEAGADVEALEELLASMGATLVPLFGTSEDRLRARAAEARAADAEAEVPDLSVYYRVEAPVERLDELAEQMRSLGVVDAAYFKPPPAPASLKPDTTVHQGYLDRIPGGIDVCCAWNVPGGRGKDIKIIDVEGAWRFTHEDLAENQGGLVSGTAHPHLYWRNHGTAVFGELGGASNAFGITGICPGASLQGSSVFETDSAGNVVFNSARAIFDAANSLRKGDIILIEIHRPGPRFNYIDEETQGNQNGYIAIEWWPEDFDAILYATQLGVIVVELAGNGAEDLDDLLYNTPHPSFPANWTNPFNRANRDSGAIVVGAGAPPPGTHNSSVHGPDRSRLEFSNFGALVDAQGWGEEVSTTGYGNGHPGSILTSTTSEDEFYTETFSGTSSASPIVVGALACVQGALLARNDPNSPLLTPATARQLLRDTGSPQQDAPSRPKTQRIGNRPNLCQMMDKAFEASPDHRGHVAELFFQRTNWQPNDLTSVATSIRPNVTEIPSAAGDPAGYTWEGDGGQHVVYRGHDNHIHELFFLGTSWQHNDLTVDADANPIAAGNPFGYTWDGDGGQHVVYRDHDGHIQELFFQGTNWQRNDLTVAANNAPLAGGDPAGYTWDGDGGQHVVYRGQDDHIQELFFQGTNWQHNDLTVAANNAPLAGGDPAGYTWSGDGGQHVVYRDHDGHIQELFFQGANWRNNDLTNAAVSPSLAVGDPHGYTWDGDGGQHVVYRADSGEIHELFFQGTNWQHNDLTSAATSISPTATSPPPAAGDPTGYTWGGDGGQHVVYRGIDCRIHELFFQGTQWQHNDLTEAAGNPPPAIGDPDGYTWDGDGGQHVVYRQR